MAEQGKTDALLIVKVPVANLRREPVEARKAHSHDDLQQTQLLFNETLIYHAEVPGWYRVEAREQLKADAEKGWRGYPGWVKKESVSFVTEIPRCNGIVKKRIARLLSEPAEEAPTLFFVSLGTRLELTEESAAHSNPYFRVIIGKGEFAWVHNNDVSMTLQSTSENNLRDNLVRTASLFVGVPYLWGGRSMFMADLTATVTGVDCSGLTNLVYRVNNINIPRDAHDQWIAAGIAAGLAHSPATENITNGSPEAGDLIFVSRAMRPDLIDHVMLSVGGERFIEAAETGSRMKERTFQEKFGADLAKLDKLKLTIQEKRIYFGSAARLAKAT
jgi:gamma-D-glutamyl-L-lysine dipeptidyl-peptidase